MAWNELYEPENSLHHAQVLFVPPSPIHPHIYSNGHICLDILYDGMPCSNCLSHTMGAFLSLSFSSLQECACSCVKYGLVSLLHLLLASQAGTAMLSSVCAGRNGGWSPALTINKLCLSLMSMLASNTELVRSHTFDSFGVGQCISLYLGRAVFENFGPQDYASYVYGISS